MAPNNSFKPTQLRGGNVLRLGRSYFAAAKPVGLTQALALFEKNMRNSLKALAILACAATTSCVAIYQTKSPTASNFTFQRGLAYLGGTSGQEYAAFNNESCITSDESGRLAYLSTYGADQKIERVAAEKPIYLLATILQYSSAAYSNPEPTIALILSHCSNLVRFSPRAGHRYLIKQDGSLEACQLSVIDESTSVAPPDIEALNSKQCESTWLK